MDSISQLLLDECTDGMILARKSAGEWALEYANKTACQLLDLDPEALQGRHPVAVIRSLLTPEQREPFETAFREGEFSLIEFSPVHDRPEKLISMRTRFRQLDGDPVWSGVLEDLSTKRKMSQDLYYERERLAQVLRYIREGVIVVDPEGEIQYLNRVAEELTGWKRLEAAGESSTMVVRLVEAVSREPVSCPLQKVVATGMGVGETTDCHLLNRAGKSLQVSYLVSPLKSTDKVPLGAVMIFRDETQKKQLEDEQIKTEAMEVLTLMIGGVAHDFNNLLTGIHGNVSLALLQDLPPGVSSRLAPLEQAAQRASNLSQQLLSLSRGNAPVMQPGWVPRLVEEICMFSLSGSGIELDLTYSDDLWPCLMEEGRISRVLNNLVINARHAMKDEGVLKVRLSNATLVRQSGIPLKPGTYVCIEVEDTGQGISPEHLPRIFDPYFTTKERGTGLGLANCKAIIRQHKGHIAVTSETGKGTLFRIYLPAAPGADTEADTADDPAAVHHGKGRVLLMDDEVLVQQIAGDILKHLGYEPAVACSGEEALDLVKASRQTNESFTAIILDLTVPGKMGGMDTMKHLESLAPEIPVLVSSGYSGDPVMKRCGEYGFSASVLKPYTIQQLSLALKTAIQGSNR